MHVFTDSIFLLATPQHRILMNSVQTLIIYKKRSTTPLSTAAIRWAYGNDVMWSEHELHDQVLILMWILSKFKTIHCQVSLATCLKIGRINAANSARSGGYNMPKRRNDTFSTPILRACIYFNGFVPFASIKNERTFFVSNVEH